MSRYIDADLLKDKTTRVNNIWNVTTNAEGKGLDEIIDDIPPAQQWISCSERLPDANDCPMDCLVTRKGKFIGNYTDIAVCERNGTWTHEDWDAIVLGDVENGKTTGLISTRDDDIIAWMPLPEPYKGEELCADTLTLKM